MSDEIGGPFTAHHCAESEHYREEANRLRKLLGKLDASNAALQAEKVQALDRIDALEKALRESLHRWAQCRHDNGFDKDPHVAKLQSILDGECG